MLNILQSMAKKNSRKMYRRKRTTGEINVVRYLSILLTKVKQKRRHRGGLESFNIVTSPIQFFILLIYFIDSNFYKS